MASKKSHTGYRDSKTGLFVKEGDAKKRPASTQKESIPNPGRGDTGRGKKKPS
jgi:hypothetical protein